MKNKINLINRESIMKKNKFGVFLLLMLFNFTYSGLAQNMVDENITMTLKRMDRLEDEINQKRVLYSPQLKSTGVSNLVLDSVYETVNHGVYTDYSRCYFSYDNDLHLISSEKYFFNETGTFDLSTEFKTYNSDGQVESAVKKKTFSADGSPDTTIILYDERNNYADGKIAEQRIYSLNRYSYGYNKGETYFYIYDSISYTNYFEYNSEGQLAHEYSTRSAWRNPNYYYYYYYNDDNLLVYKYNPNQILKYEYEVNGDSHIKTEKINFIRLDNDLEVFDTITQWMDIYYDEITFDASGRVATLRNSVYYYDQKYSFELMRFNFKAEFEYNQGNQLVHASYYSFAVDDDSTSYYESTRIDNAYDEEGNLLEYHKTFYDARIDEWVTHTLTTYYYSSDKSVETAVNDQLSVLQIYPNPTKNIIHLSIPGGGIDRNYSVYNVFGETIIKGQQVRGIIDVSNLKRGIYFIRIEHEGKVEALRFLKE